MRHRQSAFAFSLFLALALPALGIGRDPNGVNVNAQGATTVFITFGGLANQVPIEATWCGELIPADPDIGFKCAPGTIFGQLPIRFDQSRLTGNGRVFTDIMSIPPSVARRAYQAAARGDTSSFFYVRRFVSTAGGPDEYVFVTCRMAGGGARVPLALLDVRLAFDTDDPVLSVEEGATPPPLSAEISYNGTGRLKGRWEVVLPGNELPTSQDLLTEATLPVEQRPQQRRYTELSRFNVFLPPTGRVTLEGPDTSKIPNEVDGLYMILLRIEASDDKEGDSNLGNAGAGQGVVHSGAVAGFPMPVLRYYVGSVPADALGAGGVALLSPATKVTVPRDKPIDFAWAEVANAAIYRLEITDVTGKTVHSAVLQKGVAFYRAPPWLPDKLPTEVMLWRVVAADPDGNEFAASEWRELNIGG
jgi:hypothetical protein